MRHPLTGGGMTVALTDAQLLCDMLRPLPDFSDALRTAATTAAFYTRRKPLSATINTLANALYQVPHSTRPCQSPFFRPAMRTRTRLDRRKRSSFLTRTPWRPWIAHRPGQRLSTPVSLGGAASPANVLAPCGPALAESTPLLPTPGFRAGTHGLLLGEP